MQGSTTRNIGDISRRSDAADVLQCLRSKPASELSFEVSGVPVENAPSEVQPGGSKYQSGDSYLGCGTFDMAIPAAAAGLEVYLYNFDTPTTAPGLEFLDANHGAEIAYVFDSLGDDLPPEVIDPSFHGVVLEQLLEWTALCPRAIQKTGVYRGRHVGYRFVHWIASIYGSMTRSARQSLA